jgi:hypothetical protein
MSAVPHASNGAVYVNVMSVPLTVPATISMCPAHLMRTSVVVTPASTVALWMTHVTV